MSDLLTILKSRFLLGKCVIQLIKRFFRQKKPIFKMLFARTKANLKTLGRSLNLHLKIGKLHRLLKFTKQWQLQK